jgi:hypothetical protein
MDMDTETWTRRHGHRDMDMRHGKETRTCRHGIKILGNSDVIRRKSNGKRKQVIFLNPFTVCSLCKRKFVVCPFGDEETNRNYPFANGLNGLAYLCLLCNTSNSTGIPYKKIIGIPRKYNITPKKFRLQRNSTESLAQNYIPPGGKRKKTKQWRA